MNPKKEVKRCEKLKIKELPQATRSSRPSGTRGIKLGPRKVHSRRLVNLGDDGAVRKLQTRNDQWGVRSVTLHVSFGPMR